MSSPLIEDFNELAYKIPISVGSSTYFVYPYYAACLPPVKRELRRAEKLTCKTDDFFARYNKTLLEDVFEDILRDGIRFVTERMKVTDGYAQYDGNGVKYSVGIANRILKYKKRLRETVIHELLHLHFDRNGRSLSVPEDEIVGCNRPKYSVDDFVIDMETNRIMKTCPEIVSPIISQLRPNSSVLVRY